MSRMIFFSLACCMAYADSTIVLMPRGTARDKGKTIHQQFERGITARIASSVSQLCEVLVSHEPDTTLTWEQLISNVNQLDFSKNKLLVIVLTAHAAKELTVDVYRYTDFMHTLPLLGQPVSSSANCFIKSFKGLTNATVTFTFNLTSSQNIAQQATNLLQKNKWRVQQESAPVRALEGLICPAILLDIGIPPQDILDNVAPAIAQLCKELHA